MVEQARNEESGLVRVAVYGSLLSGLGNHRVIEDGTLLGEETVSIPFHMLDLGAFPGLIPTANDENGEPIMNDVIVEVYECDADTFRMVRALEGFNEANPSRGMYSETLVPTEFGPAIGYVYNRGRGMAVNPEETLPDHITDWRSYITAKRSRSGFGWY